MMSKLLLLLLLSPLVIGSECDKDWCEENCAELNTCDGDEACDMTYSICEEKGCPCPLYNESELNISVSCTSSQPVMEYNLSKLFNLSLDTSQLSVSISMQEKVIKFKFTCISLDLSENYSH